MSNNKREVLHEYPLYFEHPENDREMALHQTGNELTTVDSHWFSNHFAGAINMVSALFRKVNHRLGLRDKRMRLICKIQGHYAVPYDEIGLKNCARCNTTENI